MFDVEWCSFLCTRRSPVPLQADSDKSEWVKDYIVPYCLYAFQIRNGLRRGMEPNSRRRHVYPVHQWKYCERES